MGRPKKNAEVGYLMMLAQKFSPQDRVELIQMLTQSLVAQPDWIIAKKDLKNPQRKNQESEVPIAAT